MCVSLAVPVKRRRAMLASNPIKEKSGRNPSADDKMVFLPWLGADQREWHGSAQGLVSILKPYILVRIKVSL
jgi:hypothetical protein